MGTQDDDGNGGNDQGAVDNDAWRKRPDAEKVVAAGYKRDRQIAGNSRG